MLRGKYEEELLEDRGKRMRRRKKKKLAVSKMSVHGR
jgi:hypothetical protein